MKDQKKPGKKGSKLPIIEYKWKGINCVRAKGNTGRQAAVVKQQAQTLGKASAISARLRESFRSILSGPTNRQLMYRLNNALQQWFRTGQADSTEPVSDIPFISKFYFYGNLSNEVFQASINSTADGKLFLQIPAFDPPGLNNHHPVSKEVHLYIIAVSCKLDDAEDTIVYETGLDIPADETALYSREIMLPVQTRPGCIIAVALSLNRGNAGIVGAMYN